MTTLSDIESLTGVYANQRASLAQLVMRLEDNIETLKRAQMEGIKQALARTAEAQSMLHAAIYTAPNLFAKPKTLIINGIKVGYTKQKGKVEFDDEAAVIGRIRKLLPKEQAELLIRVREGVHKPAVYDLTAGDLKRLGIRVVDDGEAIVIKPVDDQLDKLLSELLADTMRDDGMERAA